MSYIWKIVCHETKQEVAIGQGYSEMNNFWTAEEKDMEKLRRFLIAHHGKALEFLGEAEIPHGYELFS